MHDLVCRTCDLANKVVKEDAGQDRGLGKQIISCGPMLEPFACIDGLDPANVSQDHIRSHLAVQDGTSGCITTCCNFLWTCVRLHKFLEYRMLQPGALRYASTS